MAIKNGILHDADEVMNAFGSMFNDAAQNLFNADYLGFDSKLDVTGEPNLKNVFYSTFTSDDADVNYGFVHDSTNDYYYTPDLSGVTNFIVIEATDNNTATWAGANNCILFKISSGKWILVSSSADAEVQRAELIKTLFYGSNNTFGWAGATITPETTALITQFSDITALKTSYSDDVGRRIIFARCRETAYAAGTYTGTFADTTTNTACSSWSLVSSGIQGANLSQWEIPSGTVKNTQAVGTSNELGTDTTADEVNNPATCQLEARGGNSSSAFGYIHVLIACKGAISWATSGTVTVSNTDYYATGVMPLFTAAGTLSAEGGVNTSTLIFKDTASASVTNAIPVINSTIDASSSEQISVSADGGSNWTDVNNAEIARPTAGTDLWRRIVITRTDLSVEDKVTEQAVKYNLY
jgi:hypothetical protein